MTVYEDRNENFFDQYRHKIKSQFQFNHWNHFPVLANFTKITFLND